MGNASLMTPLFYRDNYNADGKKMRALLLREVSNGTETYRLWRRDGKPEKCDGHAACKAETAVIGADLSGGSLCKCCTGVYCRAFK